MRDGNLDPVDGINLKKEKRSVLKVCTADNLS